MDLTAAADGAQKVYWTRVEDGKESVIAVDRFQLPLDAGRVTALTARSRSASMWCMPTESAPPRLRSR